MLGDIDRAKIVITNYHAFRRRERLELSKGGRSLLQGRGGEALDTLETEGQMLQRVMPGLMGMKNILAINDEGHHCYREKPGDEDRGDLKGDDRKEAEKNNEAARLWISGLETVNRKLGLTRVLDLSATPFFLSGSGYAEGTLFPWTMSDFSLMDAIECGIVKLPRVPVADNIPGGEMPRFRELWKHIGPKMPRKGRGKAKNLDPLSLPTELQTALEALYGHYKKTYDLWEKAAIRMPPCFIVVCQNTSISKLVYDYISGFHRQNDDGSTTLQNGRLELFRNFDEHGNPLGRPRTLLIDSEQLESGEALDDNFRGMAADELDRFRREIVERTGDRRQAENLSDQEILREVMNTVGKPGRLGDAIRCVVSVSMLTEGWDANTVTHILGIRAFGTQLLCEQVVGRGLRRMSYGAVPQTLSLPSGETFEFEAFPVEYAEVYGVPFSFLPCSGSTTDPKPGPIPTRVRALEDRIACEITFPRIDGYRYDLPAERLEATFTDDSKLALTTEHVPTKVENAPIVGESTIHTLDDLKNRREQEVAFLIAREIHDHYFRDEQQNPKPWLFPDLVTIVRRWLRECLTLKDNTFPQLLLLAENAHDACDRIYQAIVAADSGVKRLLPIPKPYDTVGSTRFVDFDTTRPTYKTDPKKCHISHVVCDTESWEQKMAQVLEDMPEVIAYVKNHNLGFLIPYTTSGDQRHYVPDFLVRLDDGRGPADPLNLIVEVTGERDKDKAAKVATARNLWIPAVNNAGTWGRWGFIEIADPWDARNAIRAGLQKGTSP